jgi:hypothetical protein
MMFNTKRPADMIDGTLAGVGNITKGALLGTVAWGGVTVIETKDRGCVGCMSGFGKGAFIAIGLTFVGVVTGITQVIRGVWNTPSAVVNKMQGKEWNTDTREWYLFYIEEEKKEFVDKTDE